MSEIRAILFDFGNTLVRVVYNYDIQVASLYNFFIKEGFAFPSLWDFKETYSRTRDEQRLISQKTLKEIDLDERFCKVLEKFGYSCHPETDLIIKAIDLYIGVFFRGVELHPGLKDLLRDLKTVYNLKLGIISNFPRSKDLLNSLKKFKIIDFFDTITISADVGWIKPHKAIFKKAISDLKISTNEAIFVGDNFYADVYGAKKFGMRAAYLKTDESPQNSHLADEYTVKPDWVINSLNELRSILK
ncbi:MAG: HAD family hydrolase [Candidatus Hodarchaeota archaeon]